MLKTTLSFLFVIFMTAGCVSNGVTIADMENRISQSGYGYIAMEVEASDVYLVFSNADKEPVNALGEGVSKSKTFKDSPLFGWSGEAGVEVNIWTHRSYNFVPQLMLVAVPEGQYRLSQILMTKYEYKNPNAYYSGGWSSDGSAAPFDVIAGEVVYLGKFKGPRSPRYEKDALVFQSMETENLEALLAEKGINRALNLLNQDAAIKMADAMTEHHYRFMRKQIRVY